VRWLRVGVVSIGALAMLSGIALFELEWVPASAAGWMLLPLAGAALLLVEGVAELGLAKSRRVLAPQGAVLLAVIAVLLALGLAVAWTHFA
jgi:uncharacterized membrane protein SirB2